MAKKIVRFCREGDAISDWEIAETVDALIASKTKNVCYQFSTHLVLDELRARAAEGLVNMEDFSVYIEDTAGVSHLVHIDNRGRCSEWFDSETVMDKILERLLGF